MKLVLGGLVAATIGLGAPASVRPSLELARVALWSITPAVGPR
jgi:hypothetical protein